MEKQLSAQKDFISQLEEIKEKFMYYANTHSEFVNMNTFEITICNGYLSMRVEAIDEFDDTIAFKQEIEMKRMDYVYQDEIFGGIIQMER